jgi:LacI family transcriptional regulator
MSKSTVKATILDIARELNVTASTVSRALNDHPAISEATRKAVQQTAKRLKYQPNKIASSLRSGKTRILGVIIPSAEINFFGSVLHGIEKVANENNYNVLIYQSNEDIDYEKKGIDTFIRLKVDGVIASISKETTSLTHYKEIKKRGIPLILFDRANDELGVPSVTVNDYQGAFKATQHLIDQGCLTIAHIGGQQHVSIFKQRLEGYKEALRENGLSIDERLIKQGKISIQSGYSCMEELLHQDPVPDGVFAVEDFTALGVMQAIKAANKQMPDDIAVIGFANEAFGSYITPSLSTVDQQTRKMGIHVAQLFFNLTQKKTFHKSPPVKQILEPVLIFRDSSLRKRME